MVVGLPFHVFFLYSGFFIQFRKPSNYMKIPSLGQQFSYLLGQVLLSIPEI